MKRREYSLGVAGMLLTWAADWCYGVRWWRAGDWFNTLAYEVNPC